MNEVPSTQQPKPKLLDQLRAAIRVRHYSIRTEHSYTGHAIRACEAVAPTGRRRPDTRSAPLAELKTIPLHTLRLPFAPASGDSPAAAFLRFLTDRIFGGLVRNGRSRSP